MGWDGMGWRAVAVAEANVAPPRACASTALQVSIGRQQQQRGGQAETGRLEPMRIAISSHEHPYPSIRDGNYGWRLAASC
jgi:hypothetical protein